MFRLCSRMKDSITKLDVFKTLKTIKDLFLCLKTYFHDNQSANHLKKAQSTQFTLMWQRKQQILWFKRRKCEYFAWFLRFLHLICLFAVCVMSMCVCVYPVFQASWRLSCWAATAEEYWFRQQTGRARGCRTLSPAGGEAMNESKWRDSNMLHWLITGCQWLKLSLSIIILNMS